ncbi:MAG: hypothetical protein ACR2MM_13270 [Flavobacteriaceae bacterium]
MAIIKVNTKKLSLWIAGSVAFLLIISFFFLNGFLEGVVKEYLGREIVRINESKHYNLTISDIRLNILRGNLSLIEMSALPTKEHAKLFEDGASDELVLKELMVSQADIEGLSIFNFLWDKDLDIRAFTVDNIIFNLYHNAWTKELKGIEKKKKSSFSLDSLRLPGLTSVNLSKITVENYQFNIIDKSIQDTLSSYMGDELIFSGIALKPTNKESPFFKIDDSKLELDLKKQVYNLSGGKYFISFDNFNFSTETGLLSLKNFGFKPQASRAVFASQNTYTYEIFDLEISEFDIHGVNTSTFIANGAISMDSISIDSMGLQIFKDKTKPLNTAKHKLLPNEQLKNINQPLHIKHIRVSNSHLKYSELLPKNQKMLQFELKDINADIDYITSVRDSMQTERTLAIELRANLQGAIALDVKLGMPYGTDNNAFSFSGSTKETASFKELNSIISPVLGIRFTGGRLNGMEFNGRGTPHSINGDLAMYYKDLEIQIENKKDKEKKGVNWLANSMVKSSNPNKKGKLIIGSMNYEREYYKGLPNYLWKSIQTGVVNSFNPVGNRKKKK